MNCGSLSLSDLDEHSLPLTDNRIEGVRSQRLHGRTISIQIAMRMSTDTRHKQHTHSMHEQRNERTILPKKQQAERAAEVLLPMTDAAQVAMMSTAAMAAIMVRIMCRGDMVCGM